MSNRASPGWLDRAPHWYYSRIETGSPSVVTIWRAARDQDVSDQNPGTSALELQPRGRMTRILDVDASELGSIRPLVKGNKRFVPCSKNLSREKARRPATVEKIFSK